MSQRERRRGDARDPGAPAELSARASRRARGVRRLRRRRLRWWAWRGASVTAMLFVAMAAHYSSEGLPYSQAVTPADTGDAAAERAMRPVQPVQLAGVTVRPDLLPAPRAARPVVSYKGTWWRARTARARPGEAIEVSLTAYCLKGTTRRGRYVRQGIVAADPRVFPLARYVEVYIGDNYLGRFLVDDTGGAIKGTILDVWTPTCREAVLFGRRKGTAILVPRNAEPAPTPDVSKLMPYVRKRPPAGSLLAWKGPPASASRPDSVQLPSTPPLSVTPSLPAVRPIP